ncbi:hypothetical protein APY04_0814 [Hyphomicrobium sulfonivorans]|uniref:Uncharacterized protein n=2 Tax=Hyphomicrobium sulfonivorans TaxID=121290 RepID=A0A125NVU9_HYPSL|nr:hypothetical protein APY04_0814 [Hyphomicrobium sulfonivorans]
MLIGYLSNDASEAFDQFANAADCSREEARLAMVGALIADVAPTDLDTFLHNVTMLARVDPASVLQ